MPVSWTAHTFPAWTSADMCNQKHALHPCYELVARRARFQRDVPLAPGLIASNGRFESPCEPLPMQNAAAEDADAVGIGIPVIRHNSFPSSPHEIAAPIAVVDDLGAQRVAPDKRRHPG